ncbi:uncharacterized protein LOC133824319 [Humulus lupulus]|uniref:uncharacterized protein LOC133824319 n=1 Tax=Humulus lupulus TaxID=3486 RepID=UPI002B404319|nr:uncharacterized protein LOC133824319 [Humulus lupulus]
MSLSYGVHMSYAKAWRCREHALAYIRGTPESSFQKLPSFLYLMEQKNPGTVTHLQMDNEGIAGSWNNVIAEARGWPITCLMEFMRHTLQKWFFERRTAASAAIGPLATEVEADLRKLADKSTTSFPFPSSQYEITVLDGDIDGDVDLSRKICSCRRFDLTGLPCEHALASARDRGISPYSLCSRFYTVEVWLSSYGGSVYTLGNEESWVIPNDIGSMMIAPPLVKQKAGRPKKKRRLSKGEKNSKQHRCSRCGVLGQNRVTCTTIGSVIQLFVLKFVVSDTPNSYMHVKY